MDAQDYFLSKSVLRLSLDQYLVEDKIAVKKRTVYEGTASVIDIADVKSRQQFPFPETHRANTSSALVFRDDRRLSSVAASSAGQGPALVKAGIGIVGTVVGLAVSVANPVAGLGLVAATTAVRKLDMVADSDQPAAAVEVSPELRAYGEAFTDAQRVLVQLTTALRQVAGELGAKASSASLDELKPLAERHKLLAEQLQPLQSHFAAWVSSQTVKTLVNHREVDIPVEDLPTEAQLEESLRSPDELRNASGDTWLRWARDAGIAVTVRYEGAGPRSGTPSRSNAEIRIAYRVGRPAILATWAVTRVRHPEREDDGGEPVPETVTYTSVRRSQIHRRVVATDSPVGHLDLDLDAFKSGKINVKFTEQGEVAELGGEGSRLVAETAGAVPGAIQGALEGGGKISAALIPGTTSAARLKSALDAAKNRKELDPLLNPTTPDADARAKADLEAEVAIAELEARLALAGRLSNDPLAGVVVHSLG